MVLHRPLEVIGVILNDMECYWGIFSRGVTRYYLHCRKITLDIELRLYMQGRREQKSKQLGDLQTSMREVLVT